VDSLDEVMEQVNDRIRRRAFEHYVDRGSLDGYDQADWFRAEWALIEKPDAFVTRLDQDFIIEVDLPEVSPEEILLFVAPHEIAVGTRPNDDGRQLFRVIHLPEPIDMDSVDTEFGADQLRIAVMSTVEHPGAISL
jgi:HSP20 family molecular chaperone IbpA